MNIRIRDMKVRFGGRCVLDIPDLALTSGRIAILGGNGAGKSTLLRTLTGFTAYEGSVEFDGRPSLQDGLFYLPQKPYMFRGTVQSNMLITVQNSVENVKLCEKWLIRTGLAHLSASSAQSLSGGEAARLALARIMIANPRLLLLDEPFAALDTSGRFTIEALLGDCCRNDGMEMIFITHNPAQALRLAEYVYVLHDGCVVEYGRADEVLRTPNTAETKAILAEWEFPPDTRN